MVSLKKVKFLFGVHCHQPVGNFLHVFDEAYEKSYLPFIQALEKHPKIKFAVHYSGILYDWFLAKHPEFIALLKKLIKRGQVEVLTAGHYEPILPLIPDQDKLGQINMQTEFIKGRLGTALRGLWLTERIWEPQLPKILAQAGVEYLTVDDYHFISAGVPSEKLHGYYITEDEGSTLKIFPINKTLRYLIPFKLPEETINYLRSIANDDGSAAAILADDGEKFGVWPGTHQWVFADGYLENLLSQLEANADWIEFMTFSQYLDSYPAQGRVYLPTASYFEMMEWSLPAEGGKKLDAIISELKHQGKFEEYSQFFKGGFFRNFLVKYPEANQMHKRMLQVSQRLNSLKTGKSLMGEKERENRLKEAQVELYQAQCNCAYWHGVFGGLYLNYLRHAIYEHLLKAEALLDKYARARDDYAEITVTDFDSDGNDEVILSNNLVNLYFAPAAGGGLLELDYKPQHCNLINTLARREEAYHEKIRRGLEVNVGGETSTIHEIVRAKEKGLEQALVYDWHRRICLLDHFLSGETDLEKFSRSAYAEQGDFTVEPYEFLPQRRGSEVILVMRRQGQVGGQPLVLEKQISLFARQSIINITYELTNLAEMALPLHFACEFNLTLPAGNTKEMTSRVVEEGVKGLKIVDDWKKFVVSFELSRAAGLWRFPVETVSQSEGGFEKTYQGSVILVHWRLTLEPGEKWQVKIALRIEE